MGRHALRLALAELVLRGAFTANDSGRLVAVDVDDIPAPLAAVHDVVRQRGERGMTPAELLRAVGSRWRSVDRWMDAELVPPLAQDRLIMVWPGSVRRPEVALTPAGRSACDELDDELKVLRDKSQDPESLAAAAALAGAAVLLADDAWRRLAEIHALPDVIAGAMVLDAHALPDLPGAHGALEVLTSLLGAVFGAGG